jgi:formylglycine-generating enzyme required for sulfatase activity
MININKLVKHLLLITLFVFLTGWAEQGTERGLTQTPPPSQAAASGQRVALVIGNGTYKKAPLLNPLNDADDMTQVLEQAGFKVTKLKNASLQEMKTAIQAFGRELNDGSVGLFYFAGHGVQHQGENYLFPIGATINVSTVGHLPYETLQVNYVLAVMEDAKNSLNLVFLDACRNNPIARSLFRSRGMEDKGGLAPMQAPSGSLIAYATRPNRRALDGEGRNSPYVKFLKKELLKPGLEIEKMLKNVRVAVRQETNEYQAPGYYSELNETFCFVEPCGKMQLAAQASPVTQPQPVVPLIAPPVFSEIPEKLPPKPSQPPSKFFRDSLADGSLGPKMVWIPAGSFRMGDIQGGGDSDEKPVHRVAVSKFALGRYEVTFAEYDKFASATGRKKPDDEGWGRGNRPVINVSWNDATAYVEWLSGQTGKRYRLPTEAEWEYAARAGTETKDWWGNKIGKNRAACDGCGSQWDNKQTAPVGSFAANQFGVYDTVGNVWEWCADNWHNNYEGAPTDGSVWKEGNKSLRVLRGGSWNVNPGSARAANRNRDFPVNRGNYLGFRVVRRVART